MRWPQLPQEIEIEGNKKENRKKKNRPEFLVMMFIPDGHMSDPFAVPPQIQ